MREPLHLKPSMMVPRDAPRPLPRRRFLVGVAASALLVACHKAEGEAGASEEIGPLTAPTTLAARLAEVKAGTLHVFHVGPKVLFDKGHIPGARHVGEVSEPDGYQSMLAALRALPAGAEVVLYCGCCPYKPCPNVRPASRALRELKVAKGSVLDLPTNLRTDWINKGLPVDKS